MILYQYEIKILSSTFSQSLNWDQINFCFWPFSLKLVIVPRSLKFFNLTRLIHTSWKMQQFLDWLVWICCSLDFSKAAEIKEIKQEVSHTLTSLRRQMIPGWRSLQILHSFKHGSIPAAFFVYFRLFHMTKYKLIKALMVCLRLELGVAGWKVQTLQMLQS